MRIISIANFKGGTGKTVTACNMAAILADRGYQVLVIDADPQHNTTDFFGHLADVTLSDILATSSPRYADAITLSRVDRVCLVSADMGLLSLDLASMLAGGGDYIHRFTEFVGFLRTSGDFDYVVVDCPPSFTAASVAALSVSDDVIIPTRVDAFSRAGVLELQDQLSRLGRLRVWGFRVLITMADRTNLFRQGSELLRDSGLPVFDTEIRTSVVVGESTFARQPLAEYAPRNPAAVDYLAFVEEYLEVHGDGKEDV